MKWQAFLAAALAAGAAAGQDTANDGRTAGLKGDPGQFFGVDDYPAEAIRAGEQGRVTTTLTVAADGHVSACSVKESSGSASLDQRTCQIALAKVVFSPATDGKGRPIASTYTLPVRWVLPEEGEGFGGPVEITAASFTDTAVAVEVTISGDGLVERCDTVEARPAPPTDPCTQYRVGRRISGGATRNGKPVRSHVTYRFTSQARFDP